MDDADARRHDLECIECLHSPLKKLVTLAVPTELQPQVLAHGICCSVKIHLHRVVHHQIDRHQRLDQLRVFAQPRHGRAHRRQVHQQRHAGEILQHNPGDDERYLFGARSVGYPICQRAHVLFRDSLAVTVAQHRFEHEPNRHRQPGHRSDARLLELGQRIQRPLLAVAKIKLPPRVKKVVCVAHKEYPLRLLKTRSSGQPYLYSAPGCSG